MILIAPPLAFALLRRDYRRVLLSVACFASVVVALFAFNATVTGDFNYQGGNRKTFYSRTGFPFANTWETFENRGQGMTTDAVPADRRPQAVLIALCVAALAVLWSGLALFVEKREEAVLDRVSSEVHNLAVALE